MKVISANPVIVDKKRVSEPSKYIAFNGGATKTEGNYLGKVNPVTGELVPPEGYSNTSPDGKKKRGAFWNKAKGGWEKTRTAFDKAQRGMDKARGFMDKAQGIMDMFGQGDTRVTEDTAPPMVVSTDDEKKMSKGLKIGLIVGGVVAAGFVGFLIYKAVKKGKTKGKK